MFQSWRVSPRPATTTRYLKYGSYLSRQLPAVLRRWVPGGVFPESGPEPEQ